MRRFFLALLFTLASLAARATPLAYNASDIWWIPDEAGWGLNLIHQGDTLFGTLFAYGPDGKPTWYSASDLRLQGNGTAFDRSIVFSGALWGSTGPAFGGPFNPANVVRRQVGTMTFEMYNALYAQVRYTVDGVTVSKNVQRYLFRNPDLTGTYVGYQVQPAREGRPAVTDAMSITISTAASNEIFFKTVGTASGSCEGIGGLAPYGQLVDVPGNEACNGNSTAFKLAEFNVTRSGFTSRMWGNLLADPYQGRFVGVRTTGGSRRGNGWRTDLWWVPTESGWGVNVIEEGDVLFTTFFLYDTDGRAKWYSASLFFSQNSPSPDGSGIYTGTVYESTGPWFGNALFRSSDVQYKAVGTVSFEVIGDRTAWFDYNINGLSGRKALDRFSFQRNDPSGTYAGNFVALNNDRGVPTGNTTVNITFMNGLVTFATQGSGGACTFTAPYNDKAQYGQQMLYVGTFTCSNGRQGNFTFYDFAVEYSGFTAAYDIDGYTVGYLGGARTGVF